jgi:hypothetical protein
MTYAQRLTAERQAYIKAAQDAIKQLAADAIAVTLNDPEAMGGDTFGAERIRRFMAVWDKHFERYFGALEKGPEQDYLQAELDARLRLIFGGELIPFDERQPYVIKPKYGR